MNVDDNIPEGIKQICEEYQFPEKLRKIMDKRQTLTQNNMHCKTEREAEEFCAAPVTHLTLKTPEIERGEEDVWSVTRRIVNTFVTTVDDNILAGIKQICEEKHPGVTDVIVFDKSVVVKMLRLYYDYQNNGCWKPLPGEVCYTIDPAAPGGVRMIYWGGSHEQEILYQRELIWKEEQGAKDKAGRDGEEMK